MGFVAEKTASEKDKYVKSALIKLQICRFYRRTPPPYRQGTRSGAGFEKGIGYLHPDYQALKHHAHAKKGGVKLMDSGISGLKKEIYDLNTICILLLPISMMSNSCSWTESLTTRPFTLGLAMPST